MLEHLLGLDSHQKAIKEICFLFGANHLNPKEIWRFEIGDWNLDTPTKKEPLSIISKLPQKSEKWKRPRGKLMLIIRTSDRIDDDNWCEINGYARDKKSSNIMNVSVVSTHETFDDPSKPSEEEFYYILECTARIFYT
ncbi:Oidioi.mRNA.OKI2018_I69.XSR.g15683.t1.cds [Oikopleura dioica]|uniref:Oidioi.mRNA.OKI2018_I69.XSR.g15683.t1.cds n=1 Tax=Oikopleura dioica TaxID=34765 RepID=A0ABN7SDN3_OIKDI|nr:Oidioi.mRNA.OKI2018_I69.XSR.g15683.t1.cds [Oikopleura dioica]